MTDTVRLTYRELAERLGIEPDSARIKAKRHAKSGRWKLIAGNYPGATAMVEVPAEDLVRGAAPVRTPPSDPGRTEGSAPGRPRAEVQALQDHIETLNARLKVADQAIERVQAEHAAELERIRAELERARQDAERERTHSIDLADRLDRLHRERAADLARPWWRRLWGGS